MAPAAVHDAFPHGLWRASCNWPLDGVLDFLRIKDARDWCLVHNEGMKVDVECYAGRKADERPVRFRLAGKKYSVEAMLDQWYEPEHIYYKVRADDGNFYILRQQTSSPNGAWDLVSFREEKRG